MYPPLPNLNIDLFHSPTQVCLIARLWRSDTNKAVSIALSYEMLERDTVASEVAYQFEKVRSELITNFEYLKWRRDEIEANETKGI